MSYQNQNPEFVRRIQSGDFQGAEESLANSAAQRVQQNISNQYVTEECQRMIEESEYGKYIGIPVLEKMQKKYQNGVIGNERQFVAEFEKAVQQETQEFRNKMRPGFARSTYEGLPSDAEVREYCQNRRNLQEALKEEGRRIPGILSNNK